LIIIGSADRKVTLHNMFGLQIGIFGQPDLWKVRTVNQLKNLMQDIVELKVKDVNKKRQAEMIDTDIKSQMQAFDIPGFTTSADFGLVKKLNSNLKLEETFTFEKEEFVKNPSLRYNPWSKTLLGIFI
jgi:hypothetical protein